jgi:hypothetical protein
MKAPIRLAERGPRNPKKAALGIVLTLLVLGWFLWVLAGWPRTMIFGGP